MRFVLDASVAIKWVVSEEGSAAAVELRSRSTAFFAPDLLAIECINILWKKVRRHEITPQEARVACAILARADIELVPMRSLMARAIGLALLLDHSAYDCAYIALASERHTPFVTADRQLIRKAAEAKDGGMEMPEIVALS